MDHEPLHFILLAMVLLLPVLVFKLRQGGNGRKNLPPGPWQLPVIGSIHHLAGALPHHAMRDLARRYGPVMLLRLGELPVVVVTSPEAAQQIMKTHDAAFATRPQTATIRALTKDGVGIAFAPHGDHWRQLRKLCVTEVLSSRRVRSLRRGREAEAARLAASVSSAAAAAPDGLVNVSSRLAQFVSDVAVRAVVGDKLRDRDLFLQVLEEGVRLTAGFSLADFFPSSWLARALSTTAHRLEAQGHAMRRLMDGVIQDHLKRKAAGASLGDDEEEEDLLDVLLRIQKDGGLQVPLDMSTIRAVITDLFSAGSEPTATTLQWAMAELMRSTEALGKAQAEVRQALAGRSRVTEDALPELRYLQMVIKETLRLHPAGPLLLPRECLETRSVLGFDVPKGAMVLINGWAIGRDAASWGPDAEEFRPERFLQGQGNNVDYRGTDPRFVPFGAGRRICPGVDLGLANMELALATLLFHFDWELPGGAPPGELDMTEVLGITARRKTDLWLHPTIRVPLPPAA